MSEQTDEKGRPMTYWGGLPPPQTKPEQPEELGCYIPDLCSAGISTRIDDDGDVFHKRRGSQWRQCDRCTKFGARGA